MAQFLSEKLITTMGTLAFNLITESVEEKTGVIDLTTEEVIEAFRQSRLASEYQAGNDNVK